MTGTPQAPLADDRFYFRQLLAGRDFARGDQLATQMVNFSYLLGDRGTGECVVVDPAYRVADLLEVVEADGMRLTGALVTHYHPDHCGGSMMGMSIEGVAELLELASVPIHVQRAEAEWVSKVTPLGADDLTCHDPGDVVRVGELNIELLHTPGHTPGSQCFLANGCLVSGDTLFLDGCGRTDLPGGDPEELYRSLHGVLAKVPDEAVLFPGHRYSPMSSSTLGETRRMNMVFKPRNAEEWLRVFGG